MLSKSILSVAFCASAALAQSSLPVQRVLNCAQTDAPRTIQELTNLLRSIGDIRQVTPAFEQRTITVQAPVAQAELAEWLFSVLDAATPGGGRHQYVIPGAADDVVLVLYPAQAVDMRQLQELVNALRSIAEIQRVVAFSPQKSITVRGQAWQTDLAEWLLEQLGNPSAGQSLAAYTVAGPPRTFANGKPFPMGAPFPTAVRIFYLPAGTTLESLQQTVNSIRKQAQVMRIVSYSGHPAVVMRGTDVEASAAAGLLSAAK